MKKLSKLNNDLFSNQALNNIQKKSIKGGIQMTEKNEPRQTAGGVTFMYTVFVAD